MGWNRTRRRKVITLHTNTTGKVATVITLPRDWILGRVAENTALTLDKYAPLRVDSRVVYSRRVQPLQGKIRLLLSPALIHL